MTGGIAAVHVHGPTSHVPWPRLSVAGPGCGVGLACSRASIVAFMSGAGLYSDDPCCSSSSTCGH